MTPQHWVTRNKYKLFFIGYLHKHLIVCPVSLILMICLWPPGTTLIWKDWQIGIATGKTSAPFLRMDYDYTVGVESLGAKIRIHIKWVAIEIERYLVIPENNLSLQSITCSGVSFTNSAQMSTDTVFFLLIWKCKWYKTYKNFDMLNTV